MKVMFKSILLYIRRSQDVLANSESNSKCPRTTSVSQWKAWLITNHGSNSNLQRCSLSQETNLACLLQRDTYSYEIISLLYLFHIIYLCVI